MQFVEPCGPMAVLSVMPARTIWHRAPVLGAAAAQGLILVALFGGVRIPSAPVEPATIEMIQLPPVPPAEPAPEPQSNPAAAAMPPQPDAPVKSADALLPMAAPPEPVAETPPSPPQADPMPEPPPVAQQAPAPEPSVTPEDATSPPPVTLPVVQPPPPPVPPARPVVRPVASKPIRPPPRVTVSRPGLPDVAAPPVQTAAVAVAAAAPTSPDGSAQAESRSEETLRGRIRDAVQAAVRCPAAAQMMGRSGKAGVAFDYRDGVLTGDVRLTRSTDTPMLDAAALAAVREAHYPKAPPEVGEHVLHLLIWVEEACDG